MTPERIVSLVPSLTELVWWFGLGDRLVGRTTFCIEPRDSIEAVPRIGGTKNPNIAKIVASAPDIVIANREENRREDVEALEAAGLDVLLTDPNTVGEAVEMIAGLGERLGCAARAAELVAKVRAELAAPLPALRPRTFVAVWKEPLLGLGSNSYGHSLIEAAGAINILGDRPRYPEVTTDEVSTLRPDLVLLPDEPYPFKDADRALFEPIADVRLVDGQSLWWYGPRMPAALRHLRELFAGGGEDRGSGGRELR